MVGHQPIPARRAVLGALALGAVGSVAGCSLRLQRDAPAIPGIKTQSPPADALAFSAAVSASRSLAALAVTTPKPWGPRLAAIHREQTRRLVQVMASAGITAPPAVSSSTTGPATSSNATLAVAELAQVNPTSLQYARASTAVNTPSFCALLATCAAAATVLGHPLDLPGAPDQQLSLALVPGVRRAVYALEVIAAQTPVKERSLVSSSVVTLTAARSRLEATAGSKAPAAPLSYRLPVAPTSAARRSALGRAVLSDLIEATARATAANHGSVDAVRTLIREWGEFTAIGWRWGVPVTAFPGLKA